MSLLTPHSIAPALASGTADAHPRPAKVPTILGGSGMERWAWKGSMGAWNQCRHRFLPLTLTGALAQYSTGRVDSQDSHTAKRANITQQGDTEFERAQKYGVKESIAR